MSTRAISAVIVAIATIAAVLFWTTRQHEQEPVATTDANVERPTVSDAAAPAPLAPAGTRERDDWFPDLSDGSRPATPGADGVRDTFGCDIDRLLGQFSLLLESEEGAQFRDQMLSVLSASGDAEMLLAASQLGQTVAVREDGGALAPNLERALAADPMHPAVLWDAAKLCGAEPTLGFCGSSWLEANIETVLGSNGEYLARAAVDRYEEGDTHGSLSAIRRAASAPEFDNFVIENTRILERALSIAPDFDPIERSLSAYALSSSYSGIPGLIVACSTEAEQDPEWRDACLDLASRFLAEGRTARSRMIGARLQIVLYEQSGEDELREAAEATRAWLEDADLSSVDDDVISVLVTDERALRGFLDEFEAGDELTAVEWVNEEVARLREDPTYTPCPTEGASEAVQ